MSLRNIRPTPRQVAVPATRATKGQLAARKGNARVTDQAGQIDAFTRSRTKGLLGTSSTL